MAGNRSLGGEQGCGKSRHAQRVVCIGLLWVVAPLTVHGQEAAPPVQTPDPCTEARGLFAVAAASACPPAPKSRQVDAEALLACEWRDAVTTQHSLNALKRLTSDGKDPAGPNPKAEQDGKIARAVLDELSAGFPGNFAVLGLYKAALGSPDESGKRTLDPLPNFASLLATANTLIPQEKNKPVNERGENASKVLGCTDQLIGQLYMNGPAAKAKTKESGPEAIVRIQNAFKQYSLFGIYSLVDAEWHSDGKEEQKAADAINMEILRAAFKLDPDELLKQLADRM